MILMQTSISVMLFLIWIEKQYISKDIDFKTKTSDIN